MKRGIVLLICLLIPFSAGGQNRKMIGSFHAQNGQDMKDLTVQVWAEPTGWLTLNTMVYAYQLTAKDRDALTPLIQKASSYIQIAKDNSTTIKYGKEVGKMASENENALFVVLFLTDGWEASSVEVRIYNGGRNLILSLNGKDADDMVKSLNAVSNPGSEYNRQAALFK